jgi:hypothetical protein
MPDLICPPWDSCRPVRVGVGALTICGYSALYAPVFFQKPLAAVVGHVLRGDIPLGEQPLLWAGCAAFGALMLAVGLHRIRTEGHGFTPGSFLWSAGVIAAVSWFLANYIEQSVHWTRMLLIAWAASNASNIVLQLVEVWRRRPRSRRQYPQSIQQPTCVLHRRRMTTVEEFEANGWLEGHEQGWNDALLEFERQNRLGHDSAPQIVHVPDENGNLIPVPVPQGEAVPVRRRR